jgi:NitT/TauT family transport system permease protein
MVLLEASVKGGAAAQAVAKPKSTNALVAYGPGFLFVIVVTLVVEAMARAGWLTSYFPPPSQIIASLGEGLANGEISSQVGITLLTFAEGLVLATICAVFVGVLMGAIPAVYDALRIIVEFMRPIPSVAMIPLAILFLGLGVPMRLAVVTYAAFWPLLISTLYGVRAVDPVSLDTARNFGVSPLAKLWRVTIPSALTSISTGLRVSATIALIVTVTTELVAGNSGIGFYVSQTEQANRIPPMYAGILLTGILGYIVNAVFFQLERKFVFWAPSSRERVQ